MASVSRDPSGNYRIQFDDPTTGKRRTLRLSIRDKKAAETVRVHVEHLLNAKAAGLPVPAATAQWVAEVAEPLRSRLVRCGLIEATCAIPTIEAWCRQYIASRPDLAPRSIARLEHAARLLAVFFGPHRTLDRVTQADAEAFARWPSLGNAPNTIRRRVGWAKQFFRAAVKSKLLLTNPFEGLASSTRPDRSRDCFIDRPTVQRLLEACPDAEWRVIIALARYGGLRCPSEVLALEWGHILWDRDRMTVPCVKTASTTGEAYRVVPLFPELREVLSELFAMAPEGSRFVISRYRSGNQNLRTQFGRICQRAGVPVPPKPFINLRASRATELVEEFPSHVCAAWLGHSEKIADAHYRQVNEQHFLRATQNPTRQIAETVCNERKPIGADKPEAWNNAGLSTSLPFNSPWCTSEQYTRQESNMPKKYAENPHFHLDSDAKSDALTTDPLLAELLEQWERLPPLRRRKLVKVARRLASKRIPG